MSKFRKNNTKKALLFTLAFAVIIAGALAVTLLTDWNPLGNLVGPTQEDPGKTEPENPQPDNMVDVEPNDPEPELPVTFNIPDRMRAVTILPGEDYLTEKNEAADSVKKEIDAALDAAKDLGMNTVLVGTSTEDFAAYESLTRPTANAVFDPLDYLLAGARSRGMYVYCFYDLKATYDGAKLVTYPRFDTALMNGIEKEHWGIEAAATFKLTSELSLTAIGTWSEAKYTNNPDAVLTYESENESNLDRVYAKGMRANGTPLSAYSLALDYNVKGWFFNLTGNYYDRVYIDFSSYRRLGSVLDKNGAGVDANGNPVLHVPGQEKLDGGFMLDASIGKYIRLRNGKSISLNLSLTNILNNTDLRTGGFEQNRDDNYKDGDARVYKFSKNSKYFYAFPFNAFLNIGYRF